MPADSLAAFSQHWNMWKKLVFYISQLVASSASWPVTPHRDSNAHKGSVPIEPTAFPKTQEREKTDFLWWGWDLCSTSQALAHAQAWRETNSQVRRLLRKWTWSASESNGSKGVQNNTSSAPFFKPTWRPGLICIQISSCCITSGVNYGGQMEGYVKAEGRDWTDNFNWAKNGNPIQDGKEGWLLPFSVLKLWSPGKFPPSFLPPCFEPCSLDFTHLSPSPRTGGTSCHWYKTRSRVWQRDRKSAFLRA